MTVIPLPVGAEEGIALDSARDKVYITSGDGNAITVIQDQGPAQVVFASNRDGNSDIYRMLPDGREQRRLTFTNDAYETSPVGSPNGRWIAMVRADASGPDTRQFEVRGAFEINRLNKIPTLTRVP